MIRILIATLSLALSSDLWSADHVALEKLFKEYFWSDLIYQQNECGMNIQRFFKLAHSKKINLDHVYLVRVEDYSGSSIEGVTTRQTREGGCIIRPVPTKPPRYEVGLRHFFHHIFMVADNRVYDFDYLNTPTVIPLPEYMLKMFIEARKWKSPFEWRRTLGLHTLDWYSMKIKKNDLELIPFKKGKIEELYPEWIRTLPPGCSELLVH